MINTAMYASSPIYVDRLTRAVYIYLCVMYSGIEELMRG